MDLVTEGRQLPRPMMRPGAGFHADEAGFQPREEHKHLRPAKDDDPSFSYPVNLKDVLGQIEASNVFHMLE